MNDTKRCDHIDELERIVMQAHSICDKILLFQAIEMEEHDVRLLLASHHITDGTAQDTYLSLVRKYDEQTSSGKAG